MFMLIALASCGVEEEQSTQEETVVPCLSFAEDIVVEKIGSEKSDAIDSLSVGDDGSLYMVNRNRRVIVAYDPVENEASEIPPFSEKWNPLCAVAGKQWDIWVLSDGKLGRYFPEYDSWDEAIQRKDWRLPQGSSMILGATGNLWIFEEKMKALHNLDVRTLQINSMKPNGAFERVTYGAIAPAGDLVLADNKRILRLRLDGEQMEDIPQENRLVNSNTPLSVACDDLGFIYATNPDVYTIGIYSPRGDFVGRWNRSIARNIRITAPSALAFDRTNKCLYLAHSRNHLARFDVSYQPPVVPPAEKGIKPKGPSIVLITVDTVRVDHLGLAGYERNTSPNMDTLASEGVWFPEAFSCSADTTASHSTIMTSLMPFCHEARNSGNYLRPEFLTLAEILSDAGYHTAAFTSGFTLIPEITWLDQGFHVYDSCEAVHDGIRHRDDGMRAAEFTNEQVFNWLSGKQGEKIFLWVHYFDPHTKYQPPKPYSDMFHYDESDPVLSATANSFWTSMPLGKYIDLYDGEIAYMDSQIGKLLQKLKELEYLDNTFLVLLADHGESLNETPERMFNHGHTLVEVEFRIPMILRDYTGRIIEKQGVKSDWVAEQIDIAPTLTEVACVSTPEGFQGTSLLKALSGQAKPRPFLWSQVMRYNTNDAVRKYRIRKDHLKLRADTGNSYYNLRDYVEDKDPTEKVVPPLTVDELLTKLDASEEDYPQSIRGHSGKVFLHSLYPGLEQILDFKELERSDVHRRLAEIYGESIGWDPKGLQKTPILEGKPDEERVKQLKSLGYMN